MTDQSHALIINNTYNSIEITISHKNSHQQPISIPSQHASAQMITVIDTMLQTSNLTLSKLTFIGINAGPGPFTTLRSSIAVANGFNFALQLPLIPINGIETFVREHQQKEYSHTFALLDAFNNDIYYAHHDHQKEIIDSGCMNIEQWITGLATFLTHNPHARIKFIGNACLKYQHHIARHFETYFIEEQLPIHPSCTAISLQAWKQWEQHDTITNQVNPLYLKQRAY